MPKFKKIPKFHFVKNVEIQMVPCKKKKKKKTLLKRFHLVGHTIGFCPQTQKLELHDMSPQLTLGERVNGYKMLINNYIALNSESKNHFSDHNLFVCMYYKPYS